MLKTLIFLKINYFWIYLNDMGVSNGKILSLCLKILKGIQKLFIFIIFFVTRIEKNIIIYKKSPDIIIYFFHGFAPMR